MMIDAKILEQRAALHAALGEPRRLAIVDALRWSDRSPSELQRLTGLASNLLAFHLGVLEDAGLIRRRPSQADRRRRYISLRREGLEGLQGPAFVPVERVLFVCTRNAARSQLAAALWHKHTGQPAASAGASPAARVHPLAQRVARMHGLRLSPRPQRYEEVRLSPDLVISVCDRAREAGLPWRVPQLHWSLPDPDGQDVGAFERVHAELAERIRELARASRGEGR